MKGICRPRSIGLYTIDVGLYPIGNAITISLNTRQIWNFKYGMLGGRNVVKVNRDNVRLYLSKENFECDWEIVDKAEG
jgi:hypothetical protein